MPVIRAAKANASPAKNNASPAKDNASPAKNNASSAKANASPAKANASPAKANASSAKANASPAKNETSSAKAEGGGVAAFLATLEGAAREDCVALDRLMSDVTGAAGAMYGASIAGYGSATIRYADGREAPWMAMGFSPRAKALTLYGMGRAPASLLAKLGPHDTGKGCLYVKRLADVDLAVLRKILESVGRG
jgi:hypothetical protein